MFGFKLSALAVAAIALGVSALVVEVSAQTVNLPMRQCRTYFNAPAPQAAPQAATAGPGVSATEVQRLVRQIAGHAGLSYDFVVRPSPSTTSASAFTCYDANLREIRRYIVYAPIFMEALQRQSQTNWSVVEVLAHEIGHHVNGHHLTRSQSLKNELEADYFAGFVLARMGASLEQATAGERAMGHDNASATHPAKAERLDALTRGWLGGRNGPPQSEQATAAARSKRFLRVPEGMGAATIPPSQ